MELAVEKAILTCVQELTAHVIPIPKAIVQPYTEVKQGFTNFKLDTKNIKWYPSDDTLLGTELQEGGKTFEMVSDHHAITKVDTAENEVVRHIIVHDNVDYRSCSDLIYSLVNDAKQHFLSYLTQEEAEKVMRDPQKTLANVIYTQMNEHYYREQVNYRASEMRPFSRIETGFGGKFKSDELYDLKANIQAGEVKSKVFKGFKKACHTLYKFDSGTERDFAIVLETDSTVLKWLRPSSKQFEIFYGNSNMNRYEPDFIVETANKIYMVETKASNEIRSKPVIQKANAAIVYCKAVTDWNSENDGKPWEYVLISHDEVHINSSLNHLVKNSVQIENIEIDE